MRRFPRLGPLVGVAFVALAGTALACLEPRGYLGKGSAGPGEPVPFDITGTDPGAGYTVTAGGRVVASGSDSDGGPGQGTSGSFTMPDFGTSARSVNVMFNVAHEGATWQSPATIQYVPPAPPPASKGAPGPSEGAAAQPPRKAQRTHDKRASRRSVASSPSAAPSPGPSRSPVATPSPVSEPQRGAAEVAAAEEAESSVPDRVVDAVSGKTAVGPAEVPTLLVIGLVLVAGLGLGGIALALWLLRHGPDPEAAAVPKSPYGDGPDPVEAELQEIIAEAMARELLDPGYAERLGDRDATVAR